MFFHQFTTMIIVNNQQRFTDMKICREEIE